MDGVIADFETPNNEIIKKFFPHIKIIDERKDFYFEDTYRMYPDVVKCIYQESRRNGFFSSFPVVEGSLLGLKTIINEGFIPRICSSPLEDHDTVVEEKIAWLERYFVPYLGKWVVDTAIFDRDKSKYNAVAIIDDRPTLRKSTEALWQHIMYSQPYNSTIPTEYRIQNWKDPQLVKLIEKAKLKQLTRLKR